MDSINTAVGLFLNNLKGNTKKSYKYDFTNKSTGLLMLLKANHLPPDAVIKHLGELHGVEWIQHLKNIGCKPSTISRRISAYKNLLRFCALKYNLSVDSNKFAEMLKSAKLKPKLKNLKKIPMEKIEKVINYCLDKNVKAESILETLLEVRNRTFFITLADTGLRISEAMALVRGDINWTAQKAVIIGKGEKRASIRFSDRSIEMLNFMKRTEESANLQMPKSISSTPLFAKYRKKKVSALSTKAGEYVVRDLCIAALGSEYIEGEITPHSLRHYFVMIILRKTGNMKKAKELARHESIETTNKYTQMEDAELDSAFADIFN